MQTQIPNLIRHTCRKCFAVRSMSVIEVKRKPACVLNRAQRRKILWGSRGNQGTYSKSVAKSEKTCKRKHILLKCLTCEMKQPWARPRTKKLDIIKVSSVTK